MSEEKYYTKILESSEYQAWDELVQESSSGTIFSNSEWLKLTSESLNSDLSIYGCFIENDIVAGCPIFTKRYKKLLKIGSNTEGMMPYSGIVIKDYPKENIRKYERNQNDILRALRIHLEKLNLPYIIIKNPIGISDIREFKWNNWNDKVYYTYLLDLNNLNYSRDVKRNIKKALGNEIFIEESKDIDAYFSLFEHTFKHQGLNTPVDNNYLSKMFKYISDNDKGKMFVSKTKEDQWVAAEIFVHDSNYVHRWTAATDINLRKTGGYHLLLDHAFNYFKEKGFGTMNLMAGNTTQLTEFITGFNPSLKTYLSIEKKSNIISMAKK
ncbi:GNAT family N-acetyltransferase [Methanoplanus limicola]|uniref:BioF2-like acetyltransferase domain-containing protein n=1 Tax=Methanoplanus limicola DSM 2279 TaxID=937775 RepID=H1Z0B9_9EURY|nr:GNAT family N-acetyltransferase [Methanoplanus limicola]EHQ34386.1 hypothetical protein Metlim_0239 [Methanoplanus limicola DSM 2279]